MIKLALAAALLGSVFITPNETAWERAGNMAAIFIAGTFVGEFIERRKHM